MLRLTYYPGAPASVEMSEGLPIRWGKKKKKKKVLKVIKIHQCWNSTAFPDLVMNLLASKGC